MRADCGVIWQSDVLWNACTPRRPSPRIAMVLGLHSEAGSRDWRNAAGNVGGRRAHSTRRVLFFRSLEVSTMQLGSNGGNQSVNFGTRLDTDGRGNGYCLLY